MIARLNKWYDSVQEPWRFLLALGLGMAGIVLLSSSSLPAKLAGAIWCCALLYVRVKKNA